ILECGDCSHGCPLRGRHYRASKSCIVSATSHLLAQYQQMPLPKSRDNFLLLRHVAALGVIYGHCYALANNPDASVDIIATLMPGYYAGSLAVFAFFAISGYLVTRSLIRRPGTVRYIRNRSLRIYPAYLVC